MIKLLESRLGSGRSILFKGLFFLSIISLLIFSSCRKSPHKLGANILPESAQLKILYGFWDGIYGHSVREDSIRTDELSKNLLGSMVDSVFGVTTANIAVQYSLSSNGVSFGENPKLDSIVMYLRYNGEMYGDSLSAMRLHIYELSQDIFYDSVYNSKSTFDIYDVDYADYSFVPAPRDSVVIGEGVLADTLPPMMIINLSKLSPELGQKILDADSASLADNEGFIKYFKGLYLQSEAVTSKGALFSVNFMLRNSEMRVYYSNDEDDSLQYRLNVTSSSARINNYQHDYSGSPQEFRQQVLDGDTALGFKKLYVQGAGGVKTILHVPDIRDYTNSSEVALNEVKLVIPGAVNKPDDAPARLALVQITEDGSYMPLIDQYEGEDYFGGTYKASSNEYVFRITRYMQSIFTGDVKNLGLYLFVSGASVNPENFVILGNEADTDSTGMRLEILLTDLDNKN
jgi:hypothetical protein